MSGGTRQDRLDTATQALTDFGAPKLGKLIVMTDTAASPNAQG
jgi:hypothetical protein